MPTTIGIIRGCGKRNPGGLYATSASSPFGRPIEEFVIDPAIPWPHGPFRGGMIHPRPDGEFDLIMWVGAEFYPYVPDFVEEARKHGVSKRIPVHSKVDYSMLKPYESRLILVHPRAIVTTNYEVCPVAEGCRPGILRCESGYPKSAFGPCPHPLEYKAYRDPWPCTFATWDLSAAEASSEQHQVDADPDNPPKRGDLVVIRTPSVRYSVTTPAYPAVNGFSPPEYAPGIFLAVPLGNFEYIQDQDGELSVPETVAAVLGYNVVSCLVVPE